MTAQHRRSTAPAAIAAASVATCLLLTACGGSPAVTRAAATETPAPTDPSSSTSAAPAAPSSSAAPSTDPPATTAADACALVTEHDVAAVLGTDPGAGRPVSSHGATQCQYGDYQSALVLVNLTPSQGVAAYDRMESNPKMSDAGTVTDVAGVGDRAFGVYGHGTASIWINQGDALVLVMVEISSASSPPKGQVLSLAKTASSRL
jgi:Protein of unknown function (DUF3558)